nr:YadA-like family protein [Veillonella caviae]
MTPGTANLNNVTDYLIDLSNDTKQTLNQVTVNQSDITDLKKGWKLTTSQSDGTATGSTEESIQTDELVTFDAGKNIELTQDGNKITIATSMNPEFTSVSTKDAAGNTTTMDGSGIVSEDTAGNTTIVTAAGTVTIDTDGNTTNVTGNGITITPAGESVNSPNVVSLTTDGLNNGGNKITNVAAGTDATDAVNVSQLEQYVSDNATKLVDGNNTTVSGAGTSADPYKVNVNDNLNLGAKDGTNGKDGVDGSIGVNGRDGSAVTINGKDGSIGLNGANGTNGLTIKGDKGATGVDGTDGAKGTDGMTRIVYTDGKGTPHEVATLDDGMKFAGDDGQTDTNQVIAKKLNTVVDIVGGANKDELTDNNIGVNNVDGKLKVQLAKQINLGKDGSVTTGNTVVNNAGLTITNPAGTVSLTNTGLNNGGNQIKNIDAGTEATDAVNVSQLKAAKTEVVAGSNVTVDSKTGTEGQTIYTVNAKAVDLGSTTLTYKANGANEQTVTVTDGLNFTDGNYTTASVDAAGVVKYDVNLGSITQGADGKPGVNGKDGIATVQTVVDTINNSGWKANATGNVAGSATATVVKPGTTVNYAAGSNLTVAQAIDSNGDHTYTYDLANDITVGKDGVDGSIGVNGRDGSAVTINGKDGSIGLNGANGTNGLTIKGDKGATGVDGTDGAKGTDGMTRIVYTDGKGTPHEVATLDDGMKFAGDDGQTDTNQVIAKKLNTVVDIVGGANKDELTDNNIGVNNVDGKLKVQLAKQINLGKDGSVTTGNTVVNNAGLTITNPAGTVSLTNTGLNNGGNQIKNIGAGTDDTDAVNVKQLKDKVTTVQSSDSSISVVDTNTDPNKGHTYDIKVNNQHIVENAQTSVVYTDATGNKLYKQNDGTFNTQPDGSGTTIQPVDVIASMNNGANSTTTPMILNNVGSAIQKPNATATFLEQLDTANTTTPNAAVNVSDLKQTADSLVTKGLSFKGDDSTVVHKQLGEQLEIVGGADKATLTDNNIGVNNVNGQLKVQLAKDINLGPNGSVTTGDTVINNNGLTINGGPSITKAGIDASGQKITNIADGEISSTSKDAINGSQLYNAVSKAKTTVSAGDNIVVTSSTDATDGHTNYKVSLTPKVSIGDTTHKVIIDGPKGEITGLTNTTITSPDFGKSGRAATEEQLQAGIASATSIEKVQAKSDRNNIAQVEPKAGDTFGSKGATYEVFVDKNIVKDASREAVNVTSKDKAITVTPNKDDGNHTTTYELIFNGKDAAKEIPLTYRANGANEHQVMLADGLNFVDGQNTKASVGVNGKVTFDVSGDLKHITSISNQGSATMNFGSDAITINGGTLNMGGNKITNVAPGTSGTDVVNLNQLKAARTSVTSEDGSVMIKPTEDRTTGQINYDLSAHDTRVDALAEEIGKVGSQGAALAALKPIQYDPLEPTQVMAGYGNYRGNSAIALGVAHYKNESTMLHVGMSWAGGSSHMMANAGVTWKIGNRDSEAAIADRYRKGPVSSAYALQQEMAAMKAQNAGLKGEVADLKAENEQMKAQIAAMMAKLGL